MEKTTIEISKSVAERLEAALHEQEGTDRVIDPTAFADEAITSYLDEADFWKQEIDTIVDTPAKDQRFVSHEDVGSWISDRKKDSSLPRPKGTKLS